MEDEAQAETQEEIISDMSIEPHEHAKKRVIVAMSAVILILVVGGFTWSKWGDDVKEACFGDGEVCSIEI